MTVNGHALGSYVEITRLGGTATQVLGAERDDQVVANGNTQVNHYGMPSDIILVFGATLTEPDFLFS